MKNALLIFALVLACCTAISAQVVTPPIRIPPIVTPPVLITPPVLTPPVLTPPVLTPPVLTPPVVITPPVVVTPPVVPIQPPPPNPPVFSTPIVVGCISDLSYRRTYPSCMVYVLESYLSTFEMTPSLRSGLANAIYALPASSSSRAELKNAEDDINQGYSLFRSGRFTESRIKLESAYDIIKYSSDVPSATKTFIKTQVNIASGEEQLEDNNISTARDQFHQAYIVAQDHQQEASALVGEALSEKEALHDIHAMELLDQAYGRSTDEDQKSFILMTKGGILASRRDYDDAEANRDLEQAVSIAVGAQQKTLALVTYASVVHNFNPARASEILGQAEAYCNENAAWAREMRTTIQDYHQKWGS